MNLEDQELPPANAAVYVRMSTEHQQYSTSNQMDVIRDYAKRRGMSRPEPAPHNLAIFLKSNPWKSFRANEKCH